MNISKNDTLIRYVNLIEDQMSKLLERCELIKKSYFDAIVSDPIRFNK